MFANKRIGEIPLDRDRVRLLDRRLDLRQIYANHSALRTDEHGGDLQKTSGPTPEIHNGKPRTQQCVLLVQVEELVGRPRAVAVLL